MWEDELKDGRVYEGTMCAQQECVGRGEGGYSRVGGCEVFSEGVLDLSLVARVNSYWLE